MGTRRSSTIGVVDGAVDVLDGLPRTAPYGRPVSSHVVLQVVRRLENATSTLDLDGFPDVRARDRAPRRALGD